MNPNGAAIPTRSPLARGALLGGVTVLVMLVVVAQLTQRRLGLGDYFAAKVLCVYLLSFAVLFANLAHHLPLPTFGAANQVTLVRTALVALLCGIVVEIPSERLAWLAVGISLVSAVLDALDGWLARRLSMASRLGARFDMEIDALFILVLAVLVWQFEKTGPWVLAAGLLRYAFLMGGLLFQWLQRELPASRRRQTICVIQVITLITALTPFIDPPWSTFVAAGGLMLLVWSFFIDICWLARQPTSLKGA